MTEAPPTGAPATQRGAARCSPPASPPPGPSHADRCLAALALVLAAWLTLSTAARTDIGMPRDSGPLQRSLMIDPNTAPAWELVALPGIGPTRAGGIIEWRTAHPARPAFRRADDLARVHGIGPVTVERLRPYLALP